MTLHDALMASMPETYLKPGIDVIKQCMEAPVPEVNNVRFPVSISVGESWGQLKPYVGKE